MTIRDALNAYYIAHGLPPDGGAGRAFFTIRLGRVPIPVPNPGIRKKAIIYHDIHHLLTGYNTKFSEGEMIIAGHEIGAGCGRFVFAWLVNLWMFALGLVVTPRRMYHAFIRARRCDSLYKYPTHIEQFMEMTVEQMKRMLCVGGDDANTAQPVRPADRALFVLWSVTSWIVLLSCTAIVISIPLVLALWIMR